MIMKLNTYYMLLILVVTLVSCKDDVVEEPTPVSDYLKITLQPVHGANNLSLDDTITTVEGYKVQYTDLKCYFSSVKNGGNILTQAGLFDYKENGTFLLQDVGKKADYSSLTAYLGVDPAVNHDDPSAFSNNSPLNIANANDMHWDWNPGYIFIKVEAKVDTIVDGVDNLNHFVIFHVGTDAFIQNMSFSSLNWQTVSEHLSVLPLKLDMAKFLQNGAQTIDLKTEHTSHSAAGQGTLSLKVIQNFKDAISTY
jgi:hypothetical protein